MFCVSRASYKNYNLSTQQKIPFSLSGQDAIDNNWWRYLEDENLNRRIETALENNCTLAAAADLKRPESESEYDNKQDG